MSRRRKSGAEVMMLAAAKLPWWLCLALAVLSYFVLDHIASLPLPKLQGHMSDIPEVTRGAYIYAFASVGRYVLPLIFVIGAALSAVRRLRKTGKPPDQLGCPICGKLMVLRTARRGVNAGQRFWGCSGFPKCKGTRQA
jgi:hypothetical protein